MYLFYFVIIYFHFFCIFSSPLSSAPRFPCFSGASLVLQSVTISQGETRMWFLAKRSTRHKPKQVKGKTLCNVVLANILTNSLNLISLANSPFPCDHPAVTRPRAHSRLCCLIFVGPSSWSARGSSLYPPTVPSLAPRQTDPQVFRARRRSALTVGLFDQAGLVSFHMERASFGD